MALRRLTTAARLSSTATTVAAVGCTFAPFATSAVRLQMGGMQGPDRDSATMATNPNQFDKSFEKVISTIQERHPFQAIKGNPYDVQFGELGFLSKQEKSKNIAEGKETEDAREQLRNRLVGGAPLTPESMNADPMQKLARERVRERLDPRILKESNEAPEFYYENQSPLEAKWDMFKSSGLFVFSIFVCWFAFWAWWRNDMSNVPDEPVDYYVSSYAKKKEAEKAAAEAAATAAALVAATATPAVVAADLKSGSGQPSREQQ